MILLIIGLIYKSGQHRKYLIWGFLFYLCTIFVVLHIIPIGRAIASDRYSYIAYIGPAFIAGYFYYYFKKYRSKLNLLLVCFMIVLFVIIMEQEQNMGQQHQIFSKRLSGNIPLNLIHGRYWQMPGMVWKIIRAL